MNSCKEEIIEIIKKIDNPLILKKILSYLTGISSEKDRD